MTKVSGALSGSCPAGQAPEGLDASRCDPGRKDIRSKADRAWQPSKIPQGDDPAFSAEAFARDWTRTCEVCSESPVVNATGLCGPCTFGESETYGGNW